MQRCVLCLGSRRSFTQAAVVLLVGLSTTSWAQAPRNFTAQTLRGELVVTAPPEVRLNGQPARLSPGARIRGADNMVQMSGTLVNQRLLVHYTVDIGGQLRDVWVLTPAEAARPWPVTPRQAQAWRFDPGTQTWGQP
jgi:hypothetical protein